MFQGIYWTYQYRIKHAHFRILLLSLKMNRNYLLICDLILQSLMSYLKALMFKSSSVMHEKEFNSTKKQTTAAILITMSLLFIIINRLDSRSLCHSQAKLRSPDVRTDTQTHKHTQSFLFIWWLLNHSLYAPLHNYNHLKIISWRAQKEKNPLKACTH